MPGANMMAYNRTEAGGKLILGLGVCPQKSKLLREFVKREREKIMKDTHAWTRQERGSVLQSRVVLCPGRPARV